MMWLKKSKKRESSIFCKVYYHVFAVKSFFSNIEQFFWIVSTRYRLFQFSLPFVRQSANFDLHYIKVVIMYSIFYSVER